MTVKIHCIYMDKNYNLNKLQRHLLRDLCQILSELFSNMSHVSYCKSWEVEEYVFEDWSHTFAEKKQNSKGDTQHQNNSFMSIVILMMGKGKI